MELMEVLLLLFFIIYIIIIIYINLLCQNTSTSSINLQFHNQKKRQINVDLLLPHELI